MPNVKGKKFPYTAEGKKAAKKAMDYGHGGSVEIDGVLKENYVEPQEASMKGGTGRGYARGMGAALRGGKFTIT